MTVPFFCGKCALLRKSRFCGGEISRCADLVFPLYLSRTAHLSAQSCAPAFGYAGESVPIQPSDDGMTDFTDRKRIFSDTAELPCANSKFFGFCKFTEKILQFPRGNTPNCCLKCKYCLASIQPSPSFSVYIISQGMNFCYVKIAHKNILIRTAINAKCRKRVKAHFPRAGRGRAFCRFGADYRTPPGFILSVRRYALSSGVMR